MSDDSTKVPPGATVQITLRRKRKPSRRRVGQLSAPERGIVPVDGETPRYLRRMNGRDVRFYDLGTRLRTVAVAGGERAYRPGIAEDVPEAFDDAQILEYVQIEYEVPVTGAVGEPHISQADVTKLDGWLLGAGNPLDPFDTFTIPARGRKVPISMPLPYKIPKGQITATIKSTAYAVGVDPADPEATVEEWTKREAKDDDADESWNEFNVASGAAFEPGTLKLKTSGSHLALSDASLVYHDFDTADEERFKVTSAESYDAPRVSFALGAQADVYLKPRLWPYVMTYSALDADGNTFSWSAPGNAGRQAVYPGMRGLENEIAFTRAVGQMIARFPALSANFHAGLSAALALAGGVTVPGGQAVEEASVEVDVNLAADAYGWTGTLAAVIKTKEKLFYVWHDRERNDSEKGADFIFTLFGFYHSFNADLSPSGLST